MAARSSGRRAVKEKSAIANGFANETGSAGRRRGTPATLTEGPAWSAIRAGMPETTETGVVVLITQRQQGIPPMATRCTTARSAASRPGRSASRSSGPLTSPIRRAVPVACPIRWSIEGNHGHARTAPLASRLARRTWALTRQRGLGRGGDLTRKWSLAIPCTGADVHRDQLLDDRMTFSSLHPCVGPRCGRLVLSHEREGNMRGSVTDWGSVDGMPAKIVYTPGSHKKDIYWGGKGQPDGPGHNHAVVVDSNPDSVRFIRINGQIVADDRHPERETRYQRQLRQQGGYVGIFLTALRRAIRMYTR